MTTIYQYVPIATTTIPNTISITTAFPSNLYYYYQCIARISNDHTWGLFDFEAHVPALRLPLTHCLWQQLPCEKPCLQIKFHSDSILAYCIYKLVWKSLLCLFFGFVLFLQTLHVFTNFACVYKCVFRHQHSLCTLPSHELQIHLYNLT